MKKVLCIICLLASVLFINPANACHKNKCRGVRPPAMHAPCHSCRPAARAPRCAPAPRPPRKPAACKCSKRKCCA